ncbi:MAG: serine hydrolase domain-containing protein [Hyphomonas sp.]|uniref:serine hydrolase domain-containing protein n=1 Tax=Hyphomonas sp. TaxID=87 RepID=UPI0034A019AD
MRTIGIVWAGAALLLAACASAPVAPPPPAPQPLSLARPQPPAFSAEGISALEARMAAYIDEGRIKGIATRLVKGGEVISDTRAGSRREADGAPVEDDTIWRIYSMTKPVTGAALLVLWEEDAFELDDPITMYFPEFENLQVFTGLGEAGQPILVPASRAPTVRELMAHTAGLGYGLAPGNYVDDQFRSAGLFRSADLDDLVKRVAAIPLKTQPGTTWDYSISVDLQGALIERLSGQTLGEFFRTRLFEPLGMKDTGFFVPEAEYDRFSDVWGRDPETGALGEALPMPAFLFRADTITFESGGGGLVSTMNDYARFAGMLANGGTLEGVQILKPETVQMMATNVLPEGVYLGHDGVTANENSGAGFGLDVAVILADGGDYPKGSFMWGGAAGTWFWVDPANELYFIGLIQVFGRSLDRQMRTESASLVYEAMSQPE